MPKAFLLLTLVRDTILSYTMQKYCYLNSRVMKDNYAGSKFGAYAALPLTDFHLCILKDSIAHN